MLEPASAAAAAVCLAARIRFKGTDKAPVTGRHPGRCGWCEYTTDELAAMLRGFEIEDPAARAFRSMQPGHQRQMVAAAQAMVDEPATEPERPGSAVPDAVVIEEPEPEPSWFDAPPSEATA